MRRWRARGRGHTCKIVDFRFEERDEGLQKVHAFGPDIVGLQCNFTTERYRVVDLAQRVAREVPGSLIVLGGHDVSRDPHWFLRCPGISIVAVGDGEEIMPQLVEAYGSGADLRTVPGLVLDTEDGPVSTGPAPARRDIDELPTAGTAPRSPNTRMSTTSTFGAHWRSSRRRAVVPFKCNFCSVWKFHQSTFARRAPARVVQSSTQIEAPNVFITDDIFWMNVKRGREMAEAHQGLRHQEVLHGPDPIGHHLQVPGSGRDVEGLRQDDGLSRPREDRR